MHASPIRSPIRSAISGAIRSALSTGFGSIDYATTWRFYRGDSEFALTPWASLTRTGLGTCVDSAGNVVYGPHNQLPRSWRFSEWAQTTWVSPLPSYAGAGAPIDGHNTGRFTSYDTTVGYYIAQSVNIGDRLSFRFLVRRVSGGQTIRLGPTGSYPSVYFDPGSGTITSAPVGATLRAVDDAWEIVTPPYVMTGTAVDCVIYPDGADDTVWDVACQMSVGDSQQFVDTDGAARYLPRIDHDPVTHAAIGLLVEGAGTNLLARTLWEGAVAGTPGTAPTGWTMIFNTGAISAVSAGSIGNRITFTAAAQRIVIVQTFTAAANTTYALSFRVVSSSGVTVGDLTGFTSQPAGSAVTYHVNNVSATLATVVPNNSLVVVVLAVAATAGTPDWRLGVGCNANSTGTATLENPKIEPGAVATSDIPNSGTGAAVRVADWTGPGVALTGAALAAAFPGGVTAPFTGVFKYTKTYSVASDETLFALSAGSTAGGTNLFALQSNGTQAKLTTSSGDGNVTGTLVHDGVTVNQIAYSVDPVAGKMSISVNGAAVVETTGIAYTGAGVAALIPGSQTYGGTEPVTQIRIREWVSARTNTYITGSDLQALTA